MAEDNPSFDLPDNIQENIKRREAVRKAIEGGRVQIKQLETYHEKLRVDHDARLVPEERARRALENANG